MDISFEPVERASVSEEIIKQIIAQINTGKLTPGSKLPSEREMMECFHVSRSPIREALHALTMIGVLETIPGDGTYVSKQLVNAITTQLEWSMFLGNRDLIELMEIREPLEIQAVRLAAARASSETILELRQAIQEYHKHLGDRSSLIDSEILIHKIIARMSGNVALLRLITTFQGILRDYWLKNKLGFATSNTSEDEYWQILNAIEQGEEEAAQAAMSQHLKISKRLALVKQINDFSSQTEAGHEKAGR